ncbi:MAG: hypothetical protein KME06_14220 [Kastovskya adunca ATA6-11-RM4]|nr:hypothetical protein [Kastovskya adunca ATA6-11-RM4]
MGKVAIASAVFNTFLNPASHSSIHLMTCQRCQTPPNIISVMAAQQHRLQLKKVT